MTRVAREPRLIQSIIVLIFLKVIILNFFKKLGHVFIDHQDCIWTNEIDRFKSS